MQSLLIRLYLLGVFRMNLNEMIKVLSSFKTCKSWTLKILQIKNYKNKDSLYVAREIKIDPPETLKTIVSEIAENYIKDNRLMKKYENIVDYDGIILDSVIYKLNTTNNMVVSEYENLVNAIAKADNECNPFDLKANAYVLEGVIKYNDDKKNIQLFCIRNPITLFKNKFISFDKGKFKLFEDKIISLTNYFDVMLFDNEIYMFSLEGEKLFNMIRSYKQKCENDLKEIEKYNLFSDFEKFSAFSKSGRNPRKFCSFNIEYLKQLEDDKKRIEIAKKFNITLNEKNLFDSSDEDNLDRIIKLLCEKAMIDPFDEEPKEVVNSINWK